MSKKIVYFFCLFFPFAAFSQAQFDRQLTIPVLENGHVLRFPWAGGINFPKTSPVDLNGDGLLDIFMFDSYNNRVLTFLNNGSTTAALAWDYAPQYESRFPPVKYWAFLYDYNCDGKMDFLTASSAYQCTGIALYKNNFSPGTGFNWTIADSCLSETLLGQPQNIFTNSLSLPAFDDIDNDGDMDILGYNTAAIDGRLFYHKNYSVEHYGICDSLDFVLETMCWGHFQLKIGGSNTVGCFQCPCPFRPGPDLQVHSGKINMIPSIHEPPYEPGEAARRDDSYSSIFAIDVDGNGYKDLLVGDIAYPNTLMIHNNGVEMDSQDTLFPSYDTPALFKGFHYHSYIDADNDGKKDLMVMPNDNTNKYGMWLYKNNGTTASPVFNFAANSFLQGEMIDVGEYACPVLFDYDNDSLLDLVVSKAIYDSVSGTYQTGLYLYKNIGNPFAPAFELVTDDFAGLTSGPNLNSLPIYPAFGDLDGDNDKDMILGLQNGRLFYYQNTASPGSPAVFASPQVNYMSIDAGNYATPQLYDINQDGTLDIISGVQRGFIQYYKNSGTVNIPFFDSIPSNDTLGCIVQQGIGTTDGFTVPFFYDSLGSTRLLVAYEKGKIFEYDNIDGNLSGCFNLQGALFNPTSTRAKFNITVSGGDLDHDGYTDLVVGQSTGGVELYFQHSPFTGIRENIPVKTTFEVFPNPVHESMEIHFYHLNGEQSVFRIINSLGETVYERKNVSVNEKISTSSWSAGMYFVQLVSGKYNLSRKIVVK